MSNQRYAGPIVHGTNLTPYESAELDRHIAAATRTDFDDLSRLLHADDERREESRLANRCALLASLCVLCFLALFAGVASAQSSPPVVRSAVLSWTAPTACAGGAPISHCAVLGYSVQKRDGSTWAEVGTTPADVTTFTHSNLPLGTHTYRVLATSANGPSAPSNEGSKVIDVPGAPGSIVITVTVTVTP